MAIINFSPLVSEARGKVGDLVFSRNTYGSYVRQRVDPAQPASTHRDTYQDNYTDCVQAWQDLTNVQRTKWNERVIDWNRSNIFGDEAKLTGYNLFLKLNLNLTKAGYAIIDEPPKFLAPTIKIPQSLTADVSLSDLTITWSPAANIFNPAIIYCTDNQSSGKTFVKSEYRLLVVRTTGSSFNLWTTFNTYFGHVPVAGDKIFVKIQSLLTTTGLVGIKRSISTIVVP